MSMFLVDMQHMDAMERKPAVKGLNSSNSRVSQSGSSYDDCPFFGRLMPFFRMRWLLQDSNLVSMQDIVVVSYRVHPIHFALRLVAL